MQQGLFEHKNPPERYHRDLRIHNAAEEATKGGQQRVGYSISALKLEHNAQLE